MPKKYEKMHTGANFLACILIRGHQLSHEVMRRSNMKHAHKVLIIVMNNHMIS